MIRKDQCDESFLKKAADAFRTTRAYFSGAGRKKDFFYDYYQKFFRSGVRKLQTKKSLEWFRKEVSNLNVNRRALLKNPTLDKVSSPTAGSMFMYVYDPKHKKTLPYYDMFPLIIMVEPAPGGFYGINLHYLPPVARAKLFDRLRELVNNKKFNEKTRFKLTYQLLKESSKLEMFRPCFKHYLASHVKSQVAMVNPAEWEMVLFLPTEDFKKATKEKVWAESRKIAKGARG